jgi:surface polysaccharide O-acyltransferase-like enzyme
VDIIRVLAIFFVILLHSSGFPFKIINDPATFVDISNFFSSDAYAAIGYLGVPLFIMSSGALLLAPEKLDESPHVFFSKRFNRIAYAFVFWTAVYFIWQLAVVKHDSFSITYLSRGILMGSYEHLWFLYMLVGLYALTPILRVLVKHLNRNLFTYLIVLWFVGTISGPMIRTFFPALDFDPIMFILIGGVGYFLLGIYLVKTKANRKLASLFVTFGVLGAFLGDWAVAFYMGSDATGIFHNYMSPTIILGSAGLFFILLTIPANRLEGHGAANSVIHWISKNTLPIYLIHMMIIDILAGGVFGGQTLIYVGNKLIDAPMLAAVTFTVSCLIIYPLKKIPVIQKIIG